MSIEQKFMTAKEVMAILNIKSLTTLGKYRAKGLKSYRATGGRSVRYLLSDVLEFMQAESDPESVAMSSSESIG